MSQESRDQPVTLSYRPVNHIRFIALGLLLVIGASPTGLLQAADGYDLPPISYSSSEPVNGLSEWQQRLDSKQLTLQHDKTTGYLPDVLKSLDIPVSSQVLVFSQTSLQRHRISPQTPRAIYFNDDIYVGYCLRGDVLELSTADPKLGAVFYTLNQQADSPPRLLRETDECLQCHQSSRTEGVPGHLVRSLFTDPRGQPIFSGGSTNVDHTTPFSKRWGGWYVTGTHGDQTHLGNLLITTRTVPAQVENVEGQNLTDVSARFRAEGYLSPHSDLVALMVLEHQVLVHNRITRADFTTRQALASDAEMRRLLGESERDLLESTTRRIQNAARDLVDALLFRNEAPLTSRVTGTSSFESDFSQKGPRDSQGRSLRDFDLTTRMFRYPCSYLVYSRSFRALPDQMQTAVWNRLREVLHDGKDPQRYPHLTEADRRAIVEILITTHPEATARWKNPEEAAEAVSAGP